MDDVFYDQDRKDMNSSTQSFDKDSTSEENGPIMVIELLIYF